MRLAMAYEQFSSRILTYTLIAMAATSCCPIFVVFFLTHMITGVQLFRFYIVMISLSIIIYWLYKTVYNKSAGKYILNAYSFALSCSVIFFVPSSMAWLIVFMTLLFSLAYLDSRIMVLSTIYGLIALGIHFVWNPYLHVISKPLDIIVIFLMYILCGSTCVSVCMIGKKIVDDSARNERIAAEHRENSHRILTQVHETVSVQMNFFNYLQEYIQETNTAAKEIADCVIATELQHVPEPAPTSEADSDVTANGEGQSKDILSVVARLADLHERNAKIAELINRINTNLKEEDLMSLAAAIEAAKNGELGVVSQLTWLETEVRSFSQISKDSTSKYAGVLKGSKDRTVISADTIVAKTNGPK